MQDRFHFRVACQMQCYCIWLLLVGGASAPYASAQQSDVSTASNSTTETASIRKPSPVPGILLDRVVAIVNGDVILDSDIDQELRFDSLDREEQDLAPARVAPGPPKRSEVIERLINRKLILQQISLEPQSNIGDDALEKEMFELRDRIPACRQYDCKTDAGWQAYLASIHVTEAAFRAHFLERQKVLAFIEQRFRMGIRITVDQEKSYYDQKLIPQYRLANVKPPPLEKIAMKIQDVLVEQQVSALLSDWLHSLRAQGSVIVLHPGEDAP